MKKIFYSAIILSLAFVSCKKDISVTEVTMSQATATLTEGDTLTLTATVFPNDATDKAVTWSSSATLIATVTDGFVTAIAEGTAIITVTTKDGGKTANCTIVVNAAGWESSLGRVSFATDSTWTITNGATTQIWSDAVQTTDCRNKTTFNGGESGSFNIDCRSNPSYKGDLFTWQAVNELKDELCPTPWRVPTEQDFIDLDKTLGGDGSNGQFISESDVKTRYIDSWGGAYGGRCISDGTMQDQGYEANYWSQTSTHANSARKLVFYNDGFITPHNLGDKGSGSTLRCVRDN